MAKLKNNTTKMKKLKKGMSENLELRIKSCLSNTFMCLTKDGNVIHTVSCGKLGIKGSKKNTPYAVEKLCDSITSFLEDTAVKTLDIFIKGNISANFLSKLGNKKFKITSITNLTSPAHNGTRLPREKRK